MINIKYVQNRLFRRDINSILKFYLRASYSSYARPHIFGLASAFIKFSYAILKVSTSQGHCHRTITRTLQQHSSFLTCSTEARVPSTFSFPVAHFIPFLHFLSFSAVLRIKRNLLSRLFYSLLPSSFAVFSQSYKR